MNRIYHSIILVSLLLTTRAYAQTATDFFDDSLVQDIYLTVDPADWATLQANYQLNTYYPAHFTWNAISMDIAIRSRGNGSRSPLKPNLDLSFTKGPLLPNGKKQHFLGLDEIVLKANNQDASAIHEKLAFQMFTRMGLPAPREISARMYLNGEYFGFFSVVEHVDEDFVQRIFGEQDGDLYEWQPVMIYNFEELDHAQYLNLLDLKSGPDDPDRANFAALVDAINLSADDQFVEQVSKYLDPKLYLTYAALENVVAEVDGIVGGVFGMNNFYLYQFEGRTLFQLLPWDKDMSFFGPALGILNGTDANVLTHRLLQIPEYRDTYLSAISEAANLFGGVGGWADQEITRQYNLIGAWASNDPHKQCWTGVEMVSCGAAEFEGAIADLRTFAALRADFVRASLADLGFTPAPRFRNPRIRGISPPTSARQ